MELTPTGTGLRDLAVIENIEELRSAVDFARGQGHVVGVVPTMGALHAGHLSLIRSAREECDFLVVTIFVNPSQFGPHEDFDRYPRPFQNDLDVCREEGVDLIFHPHSETIYPDQFSTFVEVEGLSDVWEGAFRPGHFRGVSTVVLKLFNLVCPDVAYFGRKDYQQQLLVRRMCRELNVPVEIRTCPTVREPDGLALSSRNQYLNTEQRTSALELSRCLKFARDRLRAGESDVRQIRKEMHKRLEATPRIKIDYVTVVHPETLEEIDSPLPEMIALVAAHVDEVRLIDNLPITL